MSLPAASRVNENVYQRLGLRTIVNASGPSTRLSGGIMRPEVAAAMAEASQWCVDLAELQGRASEILAEATGAEAGYVTAGASAALMLATAACLAGLDPAKMNRLPDTTGMAERGRRRAQPAQHVRPRRRPGRGEAGRGRHSRPLLRRRRARRPGRGNTRRRSRIGRAGNPMGRAAARRAGPDGDRSACPPAWPAADRRRGRPAAARPRT